MRHTYCTQRYKHIFCSTGICSRLVEIMSLLQETRQEILLLTDFKYRFFF